MTEYRDEHTWITLGDELPEIVHAAGFVKRDDCGAVNLFLGVTRNHEKGDEVVTLYYDCYEEMAIEEMKKLAKAIHSEHEIGRIALLHKTGEVPVGDTSMIVAISSAHRQQAVDATLELIRRLKEDVPIWKKETFRDGTKWKEEQNL